jgi:hypothetical protein
MGNLSAISFAVRQALAAQGTRVSNGHVQQLLAAGLGHNNLASYQASGDDARLEEAADIVVDHIDLSVRASDLDCAENVDELVYAAFQEELTRRFPHAQLHRSLDDYVSELQKHVDDRIVDDDAVNSEVAMTNGWLPQSQVELSHWGGWLDPNDSEDLYGQLEGLVVVEQDPDRTFYGTQVDVQGSLWVARLGRRLFGERRLDVEQAQLRWQNVSLDEEEEAVDGDAAREEYERAEAESERDYAKEAEAAAAEAAREEYERAEAESERDYAKEAEAAAAEAAREEYERAEAESERDYAKEAEAAAAEAAREEYERAETESERDYANDPPQV